MAKDFMLDVDQAGELKAAFRREGPWTPERVKALCERKGLLAEVLGVLDGTLKIIPAPLLDFENETIIQISAMEQFTASEHFAVNKADDAPVKISFIWDFFKTCFGGKIEPASATSTLRAVPLARQSLDAPIIEALGGPLKARVTLAEIYGAMLSSQLSIADWYIGYVEDEIRLPEDEQTAYLNERGERVVLRAVFVYWFGGGWRVGADSVSFPDPWDAGSRVFSRNSCGNLEVQNL